jgi:hypothetical protein
LDSLNIFSYDRNPEIRIMEDLFNTQPLETDSEEVKIQKKKDFGQRINDYQL